jgi:hypothetical protein
MDDHSMTLCTIFPKPLTTFAMSGHVGSELNNIGISLSNLSLKNGRSSSVCLIPLFLSDLFSEIAKAEVTAVKKR